MNVWMDGWIYGGDSVWLNIIILKTDSLVYYWISYGKDVVVVVDRRDVTTKKKKLIKNNVKCWCCV